MSTDRKIMSGFAGGISMSAANILVSLLQLRLFFHYLPVNIVGIWMLFISIGGYVLFFDLGMSPTLGREISFAVGNLEYTEYERSQRIGTLIRSCTRVVSSLGIVVYILGILAGWSYLRTVVPVGALAQIRLAWIIFVAGASINLIGEGWFAGIYGMGHIFAEKLIRSSGLAFGLLLMVVAMLMGLGIRGLAIAWLIQAVVTVSMARYVLGRLVPGVHGAGEVDLSIIRRMVIPSLKYAATLLGGILILQTDNLVIASMLGAGQIPNYQAVAKLVTTLMSLSMMLVVTSAPFMSRAYARGEISEIRRLLVRNQRFSLTAIVVPGTMLACFADRIINLWLGPNHFVGFGVVWILLGVMVLEAHHLAMATATISTGNLVFVWPALIAGVLNIGISIVLARHLGLIGVALGTMCAQLVTNNWYVPFYTMRQFHISLVQHVRVVLAPIGIVLVSGLGVGTAARVLTRGLSNLSSVAVGMVTIGGCGALFFCFLILSRDERSSLLFKARWLLHNNAAA